MKNETIPYVVIVLSLCSKEKGLFGIRFEEKKSQQWTADWAFAVKESIARREGFDNNRINGSFSFSLEFPGCPYCRNQSIVKCFCGKTCPWCEGSGELGGTVDSLNAGGDR
jgi:hypothetical protein